MSDEIHIQAAFRHVDQAAIHQWHSARADEAMMEREECGLEETNWATNSAWLLEALMVYLFADWTPERWQSVALRAYYLMRKCSIWQLAGQKNEPEIEALKRQVQKWDSFGLDDFLLLCQQDEYREPLARMIAYLYPGTGRQRLFRGTQRTYLLARAYQPALVTVAGKELTYEDMAKIFEADSLTTQKARNRARSRWSARAKEVLRKPLESAGARGAIQFSKSSSARDKMRASAKGNTNRKAK
jgi:hypothetical protein